MAMTLVLIPGMGLTARFALKPILEALGQVLNQKGSDEALQLMERRMAMLEQQIDLMEGTMRRLDETVQLDRALTSSVP